MNKKLAVLVGLCLLTTASNAITIKVDEAIDVPNSFGYTVCWGEQPNGPLELSVPVLENFTCVAPNGLIYTIFLTVYAKESESYGQRRVMSEIEYKGFSKFSFQIGEQEYFTFPENSNGQFDSARYVHAGSALEYSNNVKITPTADGLGAHVYFQYMPPTYPPKVPDAGHTAALLAFGLLGCVCAKRYVRA